MKKTLSVLLSVLMIISIFSSCTKEAQPNPEQFGIERFIDGHAKFVLGNLKDDKEFVEYAGDCVSDAFCTCNLPGAFFRVDGAKVVKWQINKVITKSGYSKDMDAFLYPEPVNGVEPVFFVYTMDVDSQKTDYLLRASQNPNKENRWEIELVMIVTESQLACVTSTCETNNWHTVELEDG